MAESIPKTPILYLCKCGEEIESNINVDEHWIVCPACGRRGNVERQEEE